MTGMASKCFFRLKLYSEKYLSATYMQWEEVFRITGAIFQINEIRKSCKSYLIFLCILGAALYCSTLCYRGLKAPVRSTKQGKVQGVISYSRGGQEYYEYLGIPYAAPPVGPLRFEAPRPPQSWQGVLDATDYGEKCIQMDLLFSMVRGQEDCLTLNVFTPFTEEQRATASNLLPVIVYIHGGFFTNGGSDFWRPNYFMDEDVVLVTLNYRLGALGFLNTGDGEVRGNMGLKDQVQALKWIQQNIENFGGDPERVSLVGESAGAVCSHLHMFSDASKGLFRNVISQSGSALHFWAINKTPKKQGIRYLDQLGCPYHNKKEMIYCLKQKDAQDLVQIHMEIVDPLREQITIFTPSVELVEDEDTFLYEDPLLLAKTGKFQKVPMILGMNSHEGLLQSAYILANQSIEDHANNDWNSFIRKLLWYESRGNTGEKIKDHYFGNRSKANDAMGRLDIYTDMISDRGFYFDMHHGAKIQSKHSPMYLYYYTYSGEWSVVNVLSEIKGNLPRTVEIVWTIVSTWFHRKVFGWDVPNYGASHSDELALFFQMPWVSDVTVGSKDYEMSMDLVKLWKSFAYQNSSLRFRGVEWAASYQTESNLTTGGPQYLKIDTYPEMVAEPFTHRIKFWDNLKPDWDMNFGRSL